MFFENCIFEKFNKNRNMSEKKKHIAVSKPAWVKLKTESAVREVSIADVVDELIKEKEDKHPEDEEEKETK